MQNTIHPRDLIVGLQKGLALIQLFSKTCPKLTVAQTAKMSGLTQSAARRFLLTLLHERYLQTDGRYYWLTPKTLRLGQAYVDSAQFPRMVRPIVEYIAAGPKSTPRWGWWMKMNWSISPAVGIRRSTLRRCGLGSGCPFSVPPGATVAGFAAGSRV
ncbi:transcriptional regulator [Klebsiella pneumoniae]|uniref:Transcriptional regulator n=1 Tax=Klebsiella pneumoniae TaxID=573 RepID=A0A2X3BJU2_KLEPN|nr:transcriptional regulator [Klebsiella pneumoniae]